MKTLRDIMALAKVVPFAVEQVRNSSFSSPLISCIWLIVILCFSKDHWRRYLASRCSVLFRFVLDMEQKAFASL